jgi:ABC-type branched-subunit amino acid transport system substrate-binding protein
MLRRAIFSVVVLVILAALQGGLCRTVSASSALQQALELYRSGSAELAMPPLKAAVAEQPQHPDAWQAHMALARIYYRQGQLADMLAHLGAIPEGRRTPESRLLEGLGLIGTGRISAGVELLRPLEEAALNGSQRHQRLAALADASLKSGQHAEALFYIQRRLRLDIDPAVASQLLQQAHNILESRLSDSELSEAAFLFQGSPLGHDVLLQQALRHHQAGRHGQALSLLDGILKSPVAFPFRDDAEMLCQQLSQKASPLAIGVVLPLSGRFSGFGKQLLRGMELALQEHALQRAATFLVRDSAADPAVAEQCIAELAASRQVIAIIGPLTGNAASKAARRAQLEAVPLVSFSQHAGLTETGPWIFRNSLTADLQARTLADYAIKQKNMSSFGVLAPETRLGKELAKSFIAAIRDLGGEIVATVFYPSRTTDFRQQIRSLRSTRTKGPDALFIPDTADRLALIAPQLPFYGLSDTALLGSASWDTPDLLVRAGSSLENGVFVSGFFRHSPDSLVREFVDRYMQRYAKEPSLFEAQGYDAADMLLDLLQQNPLADRESLRDALVQVRDYPGVTGKTRFGPTGEARKNLYLLQVKNASLIQLN